MAIFSLHHTPIGKSTQERPFTAVAHVGYITRKRALSRLEGARFPDVSPDGVAEYFRRAEDTDRKNARVADKVMLALPVELSGEQRAMLVRAFAEDVTQGRALWLAAFHEGGKDVANPHCHLVIRDRDPSTGKRVIGTSEAGSTERLREAWERHLNRALIGTGQQVDRRTLAAQGVARAPTIHEGPKAQAMDARGAPPRSQQRTRRNGPGARSRVRRVDYPHIDQGKSRPGYNRTVHSRSGAQESDADSWAAIDADNQRLEFEALGLGSDWRRYVGRRGELVDLLTRRKLALLEGIRAPVIVHPNAETCPVGIDLSPSTLKPGSDRIARTELGNQGANFFAPRPDQEAKSSINKINNPIHSLNIPDICITYKEKVMSERFKPKTLNDSEKELSVEKDSISGMFNNALERAYLSPKKAAERMAVLKEKKGEQAVYDKLKTNPLYFGRRPGSILSKDGYRSGATARQRDATDARKQLPGLFQQYRDARDRHDGVLRAQQAGKSPSPGGSPSSVVPQSATTSAQTGPTGKSFSERQAEKRQGKQSSPAQVEQQRGADLARMKNQREEDKERGK